MTYAIKFTLSSGAVLALGACSFISDTYYSDAYFESATGQIENPYTLEESQWDEITSRGPQGNGAELTDVYGTDGVEGAYNQQFIEPGTNEFDLDLVQAELKIEDGTTPPTLETMYLCQDVQGKTELEGFNEAVRNGQDELKSLFASEVSRLLNRPNLQVEIVTLNTVYLDDRGFEICDARVRAAVRVPAQQDIPELFLGMTAEYFNDAGGNGLHISPQATDLHQSNLVNELYKYLDTLSRSDQYAAFEERVLEILGQNYNLVRRDEDAEIAGAQQVLQGYVYSNGISVVDGVTSIDSAISPDLEGFLATGQAFTPEILVEDSSVSQRNLHISIRPTGQSEIVDFETLADLKSQIATAATEIFGGETGIGIEARAQFRVLQNGMSERLIGTSEIYINSIAGG